MAWAQVCLDESGELSKLGGGENSAPQTPRLLFLVIWEGWEGQFSTAGRRSG